MWTVVQNVFSTISVQGCLNLSKACPRTSDEMDRPLPKILFLKLRDEGGKVGAPSTPQGWMGVDGIDLNYEIT